MARKISLMRLSAIVAAVVMTIGTPLAFSQPKAEKQAEPATPAVTEEPGVLVLTVDASSPAGKAGIARGDIILAVDGKNLDRAADLTAAIAAKKSGDAIELKIKHGDAEKTVSVTLSDRNGVPYLGVAPLAAGGRNVLPRADGNGFDFSQIQLGAAVVNVVAGSPAEKAGLKAGDVIEAVDGTKLDASGNDLAALIAKHKVGDTAVLSVQTGNAAARDVSVVLDKNPQKADSPYLGVQYQLGAGMQRGKMGRMPYTFTQPPQNGKTNPSQVSGVPVAAVADGSPAAAAGLKANDVITAIDGVAVNSARVIADTVAKHKPGDVIALTVYRTDENKELTLKATLGQAPKTEGSTQEPGAYLGITMGGGMMRGWNFAPTTPESRNQGTLKRLTPQQGAGI
jgi:S1-C subfamily serine protease